ncbi:ovarian cancer G-protein coupled receptor 1-like [Cololabis saira]|uniref:ovarian cancer G-protein coupled receptor 1-like n=1 Tax=Cololabis saira TaxID=129043 RepID=UPI002AD317CF|nr:ovarian cancer G-protein coupled receptor 1-like [Cololabis saira]
MKDINSTSRDNRYNPSNTIYDNNSHYASADNNSTAVGLDLYPVVGWLIISFGLPLTLIAIVGVHSLIRTQHATPVYIINLLVSDLIQLCNLTLWLAGVTHRIVSSIYHFCVLVSVGFMVCVSLERYLVIAQPVWYRFRRNIKITLVVCVVVWILPLLYVIPNNLSADPRIVEIIVAVYLLLPLPLFIFFLVGSLRALSAARSVPTDEKRRIVAILIVVLLIYMLLFLPSIVWLLIEQSINPVFVNVAVLLLNISPLADLSMYIFIRKGTIDRLLASLCCCKISSIQPTSSMHMDNMSGSCRDPL